MNLAKAIRDLRKQQGLSQQALALAADITQAALSRIENGKRPGTDTLKKVSKALGVPVSLIYALGIEKGDVPKQKELVYDQLFPVIQNLIHQIAAK